MSQQEFAKCLKFLNIVSLSELPANIRSQSVLMTEFELDAEIKYIILQYLIQKNCPRCLVSYIIRNVIVMITDEIHNFQKICKYNEEKNEYLYDNIELKCLIITNIKKFCELIDNNILNGVLSLNKEKDAFRQRFVIDAIKNKRRTMEDRNICIDDFNCVYNINNLETGFYAVFDGHISQSAATYVCSQLPYRLATNYNYPEEIEKAIKSSFIQTDCAFHEKCISNRSMTGGTTVICALYMPTELKLYFAWVGDSKALLAKNGKILQIVTPHKTNCNAEVNRITNLGGFISDGRVSGLLNITRAIGDLHLKPYVISVPDIKYINLDQNEDFFIIASDGLWDHVSDIEIAELVYLQIKKDTDNLELIPQNLTKLAVNKGSSDNITIVVVFLKEPNLIAKSTWPLEIMETTFDNINNLELNDEGVQDLLAKTSTDFDIKCEKTNQIFQTNGQFNDGLNNFLHDNDINNSFKENNGKSYDNKEEFNWADKLDTNIERNENIIDDNQVCNEKRLFDDDIGPETCVDVTDDIVMSTEETETDLLNSSIMSQSKETLPSSDNFNPFETKIILNDVNHDNDQINNLNEKNTFSPEMFSPISADNHINMENNSDEKIEYQETTFSTKEDTFKENYFEKHEILETHEKFEITENNSYPLSMKETNYNDIDIEIDLNFQQKSNSITKSHENIETIENFEKENLYKQEKDNCYETIITQELDIVKNDLLEEKLSTSNEINQQIETEIFNQNDNKHEFYTENQIQVEIHQELNLDDIKTVQQNSDYNIDTNKFIENVEEIIEKNEELLQNEITKDEKLNTILNESKQNDLLQYLNEEHIESNTNIIDNFDLKENNEEEHFEKNITNEKVNIIEGFCSNEQLSQPHIPEIKNSENLAPESADESEDEWNYMKLKEGDGEKILLQNKNQQISKESEIAEEEESDKIVSENKIDQLVQSEEPEVVVTLMHDLNISDKSVQDTDLLDKEVADIGNESDDMASQLNPEAKEFYPTSSPTSFSYNRFSQRFGDERVIAQSPHKINAQSMDNVPVPSENEFYNDIVHRASDADFSPESNELYQELNMKEAMHEIEKDEHILKPVELFPNNDKEKLTTLETKQKNCFDKLNNIEDVLNTVQKLPSDDENDDTVMNKINDIKSTECNGNDSSIKSDSDNSEKIQVKEINGDNLEPNIIEIIDLCNDTIKDSNNINSNIIEKNNKNCENICEITENQIKTKKNELLTTSPPDTLLEKTKEKSIDSEKNIKTTAAISKTKKLNSTVTSTTTNVTNRNKNANVGVKSKITTTNRPRTAPIPPKTLATDKKPQTTGLTTKPKIDSKVSSTSNPIRKNLSSKMTAKIDETKSSNAASKLTTTTNKVGYNAKSTLTSKTSTISATNKPRPATSLATTRYKTPATNSTATKPLSPRGTITSNLRKNEALKSPTSGTKSTFSTAKATSTTANSKISTHTTTTTTTTTKTTSAVSKTGSTTSTTLRKTNQVSTKTQPIKKTSTKQTSLINNVATTIKTNSNNKTDLIPNSNSTQIKLNGNLNTNKQN